MMASPGKAVTVSELTRSIKTLLEKNIGDVDVEGEISNFKSQSSGHLYFTLKDASAQIAAVMFRGAAAKLSFRPADGMKVRVSGDLSVYELRGQYQIIVRSLRESGVGELQRLFEELKARLQAEGLFDPARKRPVPAFPRAIGLVTSPTGAVLQDFIHVTRRRYPGQKIIVCPVKVQGVGAGDEVAGAIGEFNRMDQVDVIVVARGGGSLEDLWAFNEEAVARAVVASRIPVVSAVGHETDFTICDFAADLRAPTPSAAAEMIVPDAAGITGHVNHLSARMERRVMGILGMWRLRVKALGQHAVFREPSRLIGAYQQRVDDLGEALEANARTALRDRRDRVRLLRESLQLRSPAARLGKLRARLDMAAGMLPRHTQGKLRDWHTRVSTLSAKLGLLSPLNALSRGYALIHTGEGKLLRSVKQITPGQKIRTRLADGEFDSVVEP
ncbi:exodeoxyribonuclease VII large subunit [Kamptonema cortianum]|nr:exodeoxyribonuclease VII large subunit [Oscillatoria laete-virens]MDK3159402.1 exodeoxyribonuclease VII large subunit [Kamptonema cortianum]MDL5050431.1 exodeoxyribonuclease VII large subunit [Oscillatoria amoena NRMC-F 0135]MDL5054172.1 exodeoxyribonuclease VII large subunit [Oscillatoria laete-virens NRMC-F 0139]